jgi:hypothetical protein
VLEKILTGLGAVLLAAFPLFLVLRPARAIWRGDASRLPTLMHLDINARSYLAFLLWFVLFFGGFGLAGVGVLVMSLEHAVGVRIAMVGVVAMFAGLVLMPLKWFVSAYARPKFLVPPPYRDQPGGLAQAAERRRRRRAGLPPTDHVVEIVDLRPPDTYQPVLVAQCTEAECGWEEFPDDQAPGLIQVQQLRDLAATHTTRAAVEVHRTPG